MTTIKAFIKKHPLLTYFALTFAISWGAILIVAGPGGIPITTDQAVVMGMATLLGPSVVSILLTGLASGKVGLRELLSRLLRWRVGARWYAVALLTAPLSATAVLLALSILSPEFLPGIFTSDDKATLLLMGIAGGLTVGFFEELGWTGFAIPRLKQRYGVLTTGLIVGLLWGAWHFILFWESDSFSGALPLVLLLARLFAWLPAYRVLMVWVYDRTESLLVAILMHVSLVASLIIIEPSLTGTGLLTYILVRAAVLWVIVAAVAVDQRRVPRRDRSLTVKKFIFPSLLVCIVLALSFGLFGKPASAKPASSSASYDAAPYDEVDAYVERQMQHLNIPGVSLAIVEGDEIVHLRGFGRARPGGEAPSPQTPFFIGSLTKSITALAVMQLVEAGKVELDAPVQRYLPWFRVADTQASAQVTVRHLLNQTSGLSTSSGEIQMADFDDSPDATERQARALATFELSRPVGSAFEYSNSNYNLLGLIIEAASGELYADYIQKHIFTPLDMDHSYTSRAMAKQNDMAAGHQYWFATPFTAPDMPVPHGSLPSGQLISSSEDMAHYMIALLNEGRYGNVQILSPAGIDELHRGVAEDIQMGISFGKYGMGWFVDESGQTKLVWHSGTTPDFGAFMALLPEQQKGVILLFNANHHWFTPVLSDFGGSVAALLAGDQPAPIPFVGVIPWILRGQLLIPVLLMVDIVATLRLLRCWRLNPERRPSGGRKWGLYILLPLIPNLLVALTLIPMLGKTRGYLMLYMPDYSWIALVCGSFAGIWTFLRTGLILRALRASSSPQP